MLFCRIAVSIPGRGDVILPGSRWWSPNLFWDTNEKVRLRCRQEEGFLSATNPHSGCYFLGKKQAQMVRDFWDANHWSAFNWQVP